MSEERGGSDGVRPEGAEAADAVDAGDVADVAEHADAAEGADAAQDADATGAAEDADPAQDADATGAAEDADPAQDADATGAAEDADPAQDADAPEDADATGATEDADPAQDADAPASSRPAAAAPAGAAPAAPPPEPEEPWAAPLVSFVRERPFFCLVLLLIVFGGPYAFMSLYRYALTEQVRTGLDTWEGELSAVGLPLPGVGPAEVGRPRSVDLEDAVLEQLGEADREEALQVWSALLLGRVPADLPDAEDPLGAAVLACAELHRARAAAAARAAEGDDAVDAEAVEAVRDAIRQSPLELRPTLELGVALHLLGDARRVLAEAPKLLDQAPPAAAAGALEVLLAQARGARLREGLDEGSLAALRELTHYAGRDPGAVVGALAERGTAVGALVPPGDVERAGALLAVFEELVGEEDLPFAAETPLTPAWEGARTAIERTVALRLGSYERDPAPAFALHTRLAALDPRTEPPAEVAFLDWRERLLQVINHPERLADLAVRLLELGYVPPALEDILAGREGLFPADAGGAGAALGRALALGLPLLEEVAPAPDALEAARSATTDVVFRLDARDEPAARRIRHWVRILAGRLALAAGDVEAAVQRLGAIPATAGAPPPFRFHGPASRAFLAAGELDAARSSASSALADLEEQAAGLPDMQALLEPERALALELGGYPTEARAADKLQTLALMDLMRAHLARGELDAARERVEAARALRPNDPATHLGQAEHLAATGRRAEARAAAEAGLAADPTPRQEAALRSLIGSLRPR